MDLRENGKVLGMKQILIQAAEASVARITGFATFLLVAHFTDHVTYVWG